MSNVLTIQDYEMGVSTQTPQTQSFICDNLYRLTSAEASDGTQSNYELGNYYYGSITSNLINKAGVGYSYGPQNESCPDGALSKAHAVVTIGSNT